MRKSVLTCLLAVGLTLGLGHAVLAAAPAPNAAQAPDDMFTTMDANKDGVLTKEEFEAHGMGNEFSKYDLNHDGKVTRSEWDAVASGQGGQSHGNMPGM